MQLAFCLHDYFPYGGLQRDFLRIARACQERGHAITVLAMGWQGDVPDGFLVKLLPRSGLTNHGRARRFAAAVAGELRSATYDAVVGFNKMPNLDLYFAADPCLRYRLRQRPLRLWHGWRAHTYLALEEGIFAPAATTRIMILDDREAERYRLAYGTSAQRFALLPPGIAGDRRYGPASAGLRLALRREFAIAEEDSLILMVGSGFRTKGVDRAIAALGALPDRMRCRSRLLIVGQGETAPYRRLARRHGVAERVIFAGPRDDVPKFLFAADLLLHPARSEAYGMVLLEALAAGLPVLVTESCGYAGRVVAADAGCLLASPFRQAALNDLLRAMLCSERRPAWRDNALAYVERHDIFSLPARAAELIEDHARKNRNAAAQG